MNVNVSTKRVNVPPRLRASAFSPKASAGFSMIEVLVASSILLIIVMMMGMLFQQGSNAWRIGSKRADSFMKMRTFLGSLERDASRAVDVNTLKRMRELAAAGDGSSNTDPRGGFSDQKFSGSEMVFYTLDGVTNRAITRLTYSLTGFTRKEDILYASGNSQSWKSLGSRTLIDKTTDGVSLPSFQSVKAYWYNENGGISSSKKDDLPAFVTFKADVQSTDRALDIGAASAGPDGKWGTRDDIQTWNKE